jgi:hypothetical protein
MFLRLTLPALMLLAACGDDSSTASLGNAQQPAHASMGLPGASQPAAPKNAAVAQPVKSSLSGKITFEGEAPPEAGRVDLSPDPYCADHHGETGLTTPSTLVLGAGGGVKDVFVQLTRGVPDEKRDAPEEAVVLDQSGCTYEPHVFGVMKKQDIRILNSDATLHNIHALPNSNKEFNLAMPNKGDERTQAFKKAEDAIRIKCDVHPWMLTFCFVLEHPYYAVTGADGSFRMNLEGLADGEYGIKLWHETLGEHEGTITVADGAAGFEHAFGK